MSAFTFEELVLDTNGLQIVRMSYDHGGEVEIVVNCRAVIKHNTGDQLLYVYRDGKYHLDMILPHNGEAIISSE